MQHDLFIKDLGIRLCVTLQPERSQLLAFGLLENQFFLYVDIRPKMIFRPLIPKFITSTFLKLVVTPTIKKG